MRGAKRNIFSIAAIAASLVLSIAGTLAYQTGSDRSVNTFTVGHISIRAEEPNYDTTDKTGGDGDTPNGIPDGNEKLIPYEERTKNPRIRNTGKNNCFVFFRVLVPVEAVHLINESGASIEGYTDLFWMKEESDSKDSHQNHFNEDWVLLPDYSDTWDLQTDASKVRTQPESAKTKVNDEGQYKQYVFAYRYILHPGKCTSPLFDKIQNKKYGSGVIGPLEPEIIRLESYAIQAEGYEGTILTNDITDSGSYDGKALADEDYSALLSEILTQGENTEFTR